MNAEQVWNDWDDFQQNEARYFTRTAAFSIRPRVGLRRLLEGTDVSVNDMLAFIRGLETDHEES